MPHRNTLINTVHNNNIEYKKVPEVSDSSADEISAQYFGLLAAKSDNSVISNIMYSNEGHPLVINNAVAAGGLIGKAIKIHLSEIHFNIDLKGKDDCVAGSGDEECQDEDGPGVGGLIGLAVDVDWISNIYPLNDEKSLKISGYRNVGGLIGSIVQKTKAGTIKNALSTAFKVDITGYLENVGGMFGMVMCKFVDKDKGTLSIDNVNVRDVKVTFGGETDGGEFKTQNKIKESGGFKVRRFGGYAGTLISYQPTDSDKVSGLLMSEIQVGSVTLDDTKTTCVFNDEKKKCGGTFGGFVGNSDYVSFEDVKVNKVELLNEENTTGKGEFASSFGGFAGYSKYSNFLSCETNGVSYVFKSPRKYVGGFIGYCAYSVLNDCHAKDCIIESDKTLSDSGGLVGRSYGDTIKSSDVQNIEIRSEYSSSNGRIGGLVGSTGSGSTFDHCWVQQVDNEILKGYDNIGGLIGRAENVLIENSWTDIYELNGHNNIGGFLGYALNAEIRNVYTKAQTLKSYLYGGGFVGFLSIDSSVCNAYSYVKEVLGKSSFSGFVGNTNSVKSIHNASSFAKLFGSKDDSDYIGGFIGNNYNPGGVYSCSYTSSVVILDNKSDNPATSTNTHIGGYIGTGTSNLTIDNNNYSYFATMNNGKVQVHTRPVDSVAFNRSIDNTGFDNLDDIFGACATCQCHFKENDDDILVEFNIADGTQIIDDGESGEGETGNGENGNPTYQYNKDTKTCTRLDSESSPVNCESKCHEKYHLIKCNMNKFKNALGYDGSNFGDLVSKLCNSTNDCSDFWLPMPETDVPVCDSNKVQCPIASEPWCNGDLKPSCELNSDGEYKPICPQGDGNEDDKQNTPKCILMPPFCGGQNGG